MIGIDFDRCIAGVSGFASPFGRAIALLLAEAGARVHGADITLSSCDELEARGIRLAQVDLTDAAKTADWIRATEREEGHAVRIVVHNAGGVCGQESAPFEIVSDQ